MFIYKNNYLHWVIKQILTQVRKQQERKNMNNNNNHNSNTNNENSFANENNSQISKKQLSFITLPYKGQQGEKVIKSFKVNPSTLHRSLPNNIETKVVYTGMKLGSNFQIKDKTKVDHKHDLVYYVKCLECQEDYVGEMNRFVTIVGRIANLTC